MRSRIKGSVRRGQLITTYGVGSIVAFGDESFVVAGIDRWDVPPLPTLHEARLERALGVRGFHLPPADTAQSQDIPVFRFPTWAHCPECKRLDEQRRLSTPGRNRCTRCDVDLVPSRFVICCEKGHMADFPYFRWVHAGNPPGGKQHEMKIEAGGRTASVRDIHISCSCGLYKSMEGAFNRNSMIDVGLRKCTRARPWLDDTDSETCDRLLRVLQRGASNVWFSRTKSAISIPPWSDGAFRLLNRHWEILRNIPTEALEQTLTGLGVAEGTPYSVPDLVEAVKQRKDGERVDTSPPDLKQEEYKALWNGSEESTKDQEFVCVPAKQVPAELNSWIARIMVVKRLREVRALTSFSRVIPGGDQPGEAAPSLSSGVPPGWLPAAEVNGEGVFIVLNDQSLKEWEGRGPVVDRVVKLNERYLERFRRFDKQPDRVVTPRLVLIHTLAHALISQWCLDCGYPASALRERLFASSTMAGLLIYTATSDSAGSLGGVVRQADATRLSITFRRAMQQASWCASDPLCIESESSGVDGLNLAACHACVLLPEVSCEEMNLLLDRALLVGTPDSPDLGLFAGLTS